MESVSDALGALETGNTRASLEHLKEAISFNANDPLAHVALGLTLLEGGWPDDALAEFKSAIELDSSCAEAIYGQGLVMLSKGQVGSATSLFCKAQAANPDLDGQGAIEYMKVMAGSPLTPTLYSQGGTGSEGDVAIAAYVLTKQGKYAEAEGLWKQLQPKVVRPGFAEQIGCTATFAAARPLVVTGWRLPTAYRSSLSLKGKLPSVSGRIVLRADLRKAQSVRIVAFFVDNTLAGMTNQSPFQYVWNTATVANGPHTVRITGSDAYGTEVSDKSTQVMVANVGGKTPRQGASRENTAAAWARLWKLLKLKPSAVAVNYNLAVCALKGGDTETARAALERVMAADPDYSDARARMKSLCKPNAKCVKLYGVQTERRIVAITFDDGPKPDTGKLLDALKARNVTATFFAVGKQCEIYPSILKRMSDEGHEIENHTYSHRALGFLNKHEIEREVFGGAAVVRSITGKGVAMLRPPGAHRSGQLDEVMRGFGIGTVYWTANCSKLEGTTKEKIFKYVMSSVKPGAIILMHNLDRVTLDALPEIIDALRARGYGFVTLSELIGE